MASKRQLEEGNENLEPSAKQFKPLKDFFYQESDDLFNKFLELTKLTPSDFKDSTFQKFIEHLNKDSVFPTIVENSVQRKDDPKKKYNHLQDLKDKQPQKDFMVHCLLDNIRIEVGKYLRSGNHHGASNVTMESPADEELNAEANKVEAPVKMTTMKEMVEDYRKKMSTAESLLPKEVAFKQKADKLFRGFINNTLMKASAFDNKEFLKYIQHLNSNAELPAVTKKPITDENDPVKRLNDLLEWKANQDKKDEIQEHFREEFVNKAYRIIKERMYLEDVKSKERAAKQAKKISELEAAEEAAAAQQNVSKIAESE